MERRTASMSVMDPLIKEILLRTSARFSSFPAERSSRTTTLAPRRTSSSTVLEPMKPAPPVTTYRIVQHPPSEGDRRPERGQPRGDDFDSPGAIRDAEYRFW